MKELNAYLTQKNEWRAIFGDKPLSLNSAKDRKKVAESLSCDLSPENLTCDGELAGKQVHARYKLLSKVAVQLKNLDPSVTIYT
jgi:hypothetical protein